jgi:hypothetical protein
MKRYITLVMIVLLVAALACSTPPTPTGTPGATLTVQPTESPTASPTPPSATETATQEPSATPTGFLTPTPIVPGDISEEAPELVLYGGTEDIFHNCPSGNCAPFWVDYFCNDTVLDSEGFQYAPRKCDVPLVCQPGQTTGCNPPGEMATFESKEAATWVDPYRVYEGDRAQGLHCKNCNFWGGFYQVVDTTDAAYCLATVEVEGWFAADWRSNAPGNPDYRSDNRTADDRRNGHAQLVAFLDGGPPYFFDAEGNQLPLDRQIDDPNMVVSSDYGYDAGLYDITQPFTEMRLYFVPTGDKTTVAVEGYNLWPGGYNELYFDNFSVRCAPISGGAQDVIASQSLASQGDAGMLDLTGFLETVLGLVPQVAFAATLIAFIVDQAKRFLKLEDGKAPLVSLALNAVVWAVIALFGDAHLDDIKNVVSAMELLAPIVVSLLLSLLGSNAVHNWLTGAGIGFSYSKRLAAARP